jgi:uncharacterized protein
MAHGIGGIKAGGLAPFAERFREEGFVAIAFDYRNFGGSGGKPREMLSVPRQRADYSNRRRTRPAFRATANFFRMAQRS